MYRHPLTVSNTVLRINTNIIKIHRAMKDIVLAKNLTQIEEHSKIVDALEKRVLEDFKIINKRFLGEKEKYEAALEVFIEWKIIRDEVIDLMRAGYGLQAADITREKGALHVVNIEKAMEALGAFAQNKAKDFLVISETAGKYAFSTMYLLMAFAIITSAVFAIYLTKGITRPLARVRAATDEIGKGRLDTIIEMESNDEIGDLAMSFNKMTEDLRNITASSDELNKEIAERKRAEGELSILNTELIEKNREMEQIIYVTSHDLRSPLVNVQGFSKELGMSFEHMHSVIKNSGISKASSDMLKPILEEDIPESLQYISTSVSKMDLLLSGLLRLSRVGRADLNIDELDMNRLISDIVNTFEFQIKEAQIVIEVGDLPSCMGDEIQINQVFSNILDNAIKYLDPHRKGIIRISGRREDDNAIYRVDDNGIGINTMHQKKVFELFHRLHPEDNPGEGLGLTIVQRILTRHGGDVCFESEPGMGSKFFVSLPANKYKNGRDS
jgi:signal transduction histidine kinase